MDKSTDAIKKYDNTFEQSCFTENKAIENLVKIIERQLDCNDPYPVNQCELRNFSYYGYNNNALRPALWKHLLNFSMKNKYKSGNVISANRKAYFEYYNEAKEKLFGKEDVMQLIQTETQRIIVVPFLAVVNGEKIKKCQFLDKLNEIDQSEMHHRDILARILLTFAMTNSAMGYVNGMIHVLIPIYYVFANDFKLENRDFAEPDTYFCFFSLMSEIGENFVENFDNEKNVGILSKMEEVISILKICDEKLFLKLKKHEFNKHMIHLRWITLLMTNEFKIGEIIWLWDRFLADCNRFEIVLFCCVAIFVIKKDKIMTSNLDDILSLLYEIKDIDPEKMFLKADQLRKFYYSKI